jgi:hypothetical protein
MASIQVCFIAVKIWWDEVQWISVFSWWEINPLQYALQQFQFCLPLILSLLVFHRLVDHLFRHNYCHMLLSVFFGLVHLVLEYAVTSFLHSPCRLRIQIDLVIQHEELVYSQKVFLINFCNWIDHNVFLSCGLFYNAVSIALHFGMSSE